MNNALYSNTIARAFIRALPAVLALCLPAAAQQQTVTFQAFRDGTLYEDAQGDIANGAGAYMFVGRSDGSIVPSGPSGTIRRGIVRFDVSSIPVGSTINSVTLTLRLSRTQSGNQTIGVHRVLADWGQGSSNGSGEEGQGAAAASNDVTWQHRFFSGQTWSTPGGQFTATASDTTVVGSTLQAYSWTSATMASNVSAWVNNSATNFGWLLKGNEGSNQTTKRFNTREFGTVAQRPVLSVTFTPPTGACCDEGVCSILTATACAATGGVYQGNNTTCTPGLCPTPTGACCVEAVCTVMTEANCDAAGGDYRGNNTDCSPNPCTAGTELTLRASQDNTLYESSDGSVSNGAGDFIIAGGTSGLGGGITKRAVIAFDLSPIPSNAQITGARLRLFLDNTSDTTTRQFTAARLLASWGEGTSNAVGNEFAGAPTTTNDATWIHRAFGAHVPLWDRPGGDFASGATGRGNIGTTDGFYEFTGRTMASEVQGWLDNPSTNFGWIIGGPDNLLISTQRGFRSRTHPTGSTRPQLVITYIIPPPTGACCSANGNCLVRTEAQCATAGGIYGGNGTDCTPNPCPQPMGACCFNTGLCTVTTEALCTAGNGTYQGTGTNCASAVCPLILEPFVDALPIPAVATPVTGVPGGAAEYSIAMTEFTQQLHRDLPATRLWGYNGMYPGPTIEATTGLPISVNWINDLRGPDGILRTRHLLAVDTCLHGPDQTGTTPVTVVHFHGGHVAPHSDGDPDAAYPPGQSDVFFYPNSQRASTLWYHDHAIGLTRLNVYMGLAGAYFIRDAAENALNIPRGEFEIPLIIQDRDFNPDGSLKYNETFTDNFFGKFILVNGKVWPFLNVKQGKYRFRIVNGSNTRTYTLALSNGATFHQIASEQGLLPAPVPITSITLAPGERGDVVITFAAMPAGPNIGLINMAPAPFPTGDPANDILPVMQFVVQDQVGDTDPLPASLVPVPVIPESEAVASRTFTLRNLPDPFCSHGLWLINGLMWHDITDFPRVGTTEIWSFINRSSLSHPMHVHLVSFQILDRQNVTFNGDTPVPSGPRVPPAPGEAGWKDTVFAHPDQITRVIMRFEGFHGLYPFHCHILEHEDHEMMRRFNLLCDAPLVSTPPQPASVPLGGSASFPVIATGDALVYRWYRGSLALTDGPTPQGSTISGSGTAMLTISGAVDLDEGLYSVAITNPCGDTVSAAAQLSVGCMADFNSDGFINPDDLADFITCFFLDVQFPGFCPQADFNIDGFRNPDDLADFITSFFITVQFGC